MRLKKYMILLFVTMVMGWMVCPVQAEARVNIVFKTVLASQGPKFADPQLADLIRELESIFRYSSYRLLGQDRMNLNMKQTGTASLPGNSTLKITPTKIKGNRIELEIELVRKRRQLFQTVIQLRNQSSLTVGGPEYKDGYLLFNIFASF